MSGLELVLLPIIKIAGAKLAAYAGAHLGTAAAGAAAHYGAGKAVPHLLANANNQILTNAGMNLTASTIANTAAASSALTAAWTLGSGTFGGVMMAKQIAELRGLANTSDDYQRFTDKSPLSARVGEDTEASALISGLIAVAFCLLDLCVAALEHKDPNGNVKTRVDQTAACSNTFCDCPDFDLALNGRCKCGCSSTAHKTLSFKEHYVEMGPGNQLLLALAGTLYESIQRVDIDKCIKTDLQQHSYACSSCGCTDYNLDILEGSGTNCYCNHANTVHTVDPFNPDQSSPMRIFFTSLGVVVDALYQQLDHKDLFIQNGGVAVGPKETIWQIRYCCATHCTDFEYHSSRNFTRWFMDEEEIRKRGYCKCGVQRMFHIPV